MSFFEDWLNREIDYNEEITNINTLLCNGSYHIYNTISSNFTSWKLRGTCINFKDFSDRSGITNIIVRAKNNVISEPIDLLRYIEFVVTILDFYDKISEYSANEDVDIILENIGQILSKMNYVIKMIDDENNKKYAICIPRDIKINESVEIIDDKKLAEKIMLYGHYTLKGNLYEKAIILSRLYMHFEGIRKNLEDNGLSFLCKFVGHVSDKTNVRHKPNKKEELVIEGLSPDQIESIYDDLFNNYLVCIIMDEYYKNKKRYDEIKHLFI